MHGLLFDTTALAALALVGFLCGRRTRTLKSDLFGPRDGELVRAQRIAIEVQRIAEGIRRELASHQCGVTSFRSRVDELRDLSSDLQRAEWADHAQALLDRTLALATNLTAAYDDLRQQSGELMSLTGTRLDGDTGAFSRDALQTQLDILLAVAPDGEDPHLCVATISLAPYDHVETEAPAGKLSRIARILQSCARDTDLVAHYGRDEFAVLMPQTPLAGAAVFCERVLRRAAAELELPMWAGVAQVQSGETSDRLLSRADAALYTARTQATACLFKHDGAVIRRHLAGAPTTSSTLAPECPQREPADVATGA